MSNWLPGATAPVVPGRFELIRGLHHSTYGQSYLKRATDPSQGAPAIYEPELLRWRGRVAPEAPPRIAGCSRDTALGNRGRGVIVNRQSGRQRDAIDINALDELGYLLLSGSDRTGPDRIGALDFQAPAKS